MMKSQTLVKESTKTIDPADRLPSGPRGLPVQVCPYRGHNRHYLAGVEPAAWWVCGECHRPAGKVEWMEEEGNQRD